MTNPIPSELLARPSTPRQAEALGYAPSSLRRACWERERLEALGYRVIVVAALDSRLPRQVVLRVHQALVQRGYDGPRPCSLHAGTPSSSAM